ncbi:hypothetical protein [Roseateles sp.]|uniref:hypothetical protein n=1 Tax=Roseateles sp. TaxID=1971397 RepID=UPI003265B2A2
MTSDLVQINRSAYVSRRREGDEMDWLYKSLLSAGAVFLVMLAARHGGRRLAGVVAALPTITAPTLAWLADDEGMAFAISAAVGSVAACGMLAAFALCYARAAPYGGGAIALFCGLGGALVMALPAGAASAHLTWALALALVSCAIAFVAMPKLSADVESRQPSARSMFFVAAVAGVVTAFAAVIGPSIGGFATGLLVSLPLVTGSVAMAEHATCGHRAAAHFLRGYVGGLFGKAAFGAVFVLLAPRAGAFAALTLACACACLLSSSSVRQRRPSPCLSR